MGWWFLRLLGLVYLIAFVSYWVQIEGLIGSNGILPVADFLDRARESLVGEAYWRAPTLLWLDSSDAVLHLLCAAGTGLSLLVVAGVAQLAALALLWAVYLSIVIGGQIFLGYQWDALLLEAGLLALFVAPLQWRPRLPRSHRSSRHTGIWLLRLLLFKLMFLSGVTKLISMDGAWWELTALDVHYYTQPLPTWLGWYAHQLPSGVQQISVALMFVVELGVPWLIFFPRGPRLFGCGALAGLQLLIAATGNYTFFNLLTAVLCVSLLDDAFIVARTPRGLRCLFETERSAVQPAPQTRRPIPRRRSRGVVLVPALAIVTISAFASLNEMVRSQPRGGIEGVVGELFDWCDENILRWSAPYLLRPTEPFRSINGYGLFRVMTTTRPEIVIEGSPDGRHWVELEFRWKPGDPGRRPSFVAPHQPRLDWQMWFAALGPQRAGGWLAQLGRRILEGSPAVLDLLGENPFPDGPPRHVRFVFYEYEFTTGAEREESGEWWKRTRRGAGRAFSLDNFR